MAVSRRLVHLGRCDCATSGGWPGALVGFARRLQEIMPSLSARSGGHAFRRGMRPESTDQAIRVEPLARASGCPLYTRDGACPYPLDQGWPPHIRGEHSCTLTCSSAVVPSVVGSEGLAPSACRM